MVYLWEIFVQFWWNKLVIRGISNNLSLQIKSLISKTFLANTKLTECMWAASVASQGWGTHKTQMDILSNEKLNSRDFLTSSRCVVIMQWPSKRSPSRPIRCLFTLLYSFYLVHLLCIGTKYYLVNSLRINVLLVLCWFVTIQNSSSEKCPLLGV